MFNGSARRITAWVRSSRANLRDDHRGFVRSTAGWLAAGAAIGAVLAALPVPLAQATPPAATLAPVSRPAAEAIPADLRPHGRSDPRTPALRELLAGSAARQPVWIYLDTVAARSTLPPALGPVALRQRRAEGIPIEQSDRPVPPRLVERIEGAGADVRVVSRWLRAVSADVDSAAAERIARMPEVRRMEPVRRFYRPATAAVEAALAGYLAPPDTLYGANYDALVQIGVPSAHALGFNGKGVRIAIFDAGFDPGHEALSSRTILARYDFIQKDTIVRDEPGEAFPQMAHGTATWSVLGGYAPGVLVGPAYAASFLLAKTEENNQLVDSHADEDRWVAAAQWADSLGAQIISSSLTYRYDFPDGDYAFSLMDGRSTPTSRAAVMAARKGILVVNSMGNNGPAPETLGAPADADSIISVGAIDSAGNPAVFFGGTGTSRGPTADGRIKPELSARGVNVTVAVAGTRAGYATESGTSFSAPLIAGGAALVKQAWPNLGPQAIRQALILSAPRMVADNSIGYGPPDVGSAIVFPEGLGLSGVTPSDALGNALAVAPTFTWVASVVSPVVRPVVYRVDVARDSAFVGIVYSDTVSDASALTARRAFRPTPGLWWRVVASAGASIRRMTRVAGPFTIPRWVQLDTLNGPGVTYAPPRPTFRWTALAAPAPVGPLVFDVQILSLTGQVLQTIRDVTTTTARPPAPLDINASYRWRVIARTQLGLADTAASAQPFIVQSAEQPAATVLYQNFPNPFPQLDVDLSGVTHVWFDLSRRSDVELAIYDMHGRLVRQLIPSSTGCGRITLDPGLYGRSPGSDPCVSTSWDGTDGSGRRASRGVYLLRLRAGGEVQTRHIVYLPDRS